MNRTDFFTTGVLPTHEDLDWLNIALKVSQGHRYLGQHDWLFVCLRDHLWLCLFHLIQDWGITAARSIYKLYNFGILRSVAPIWYQVCCCVPHFGGWKIYPKKVCKIAFFAISFFNFCYKLQILVSNYREIYFLKKCHRDLVYLEP